MNASHPLDLQQNHASARPRIGSYFNLPTAVLFLVAIVAAVGVFYFIDQFGVNVPSGGDWDLLQTLDGWATHGIDLSSIFAFHNEHRIAATRLLLGGFVTGVDGNLKTALFFNALFMLGTLAIVLVFLLKERRHSLFVVAAFVAIAPLVTGWFQWQNLLRAFQFPWFLLPFIVAVCIWAICSVRRTRHYLFIAMPLLLVALYSLSIGVIVWLAILPALALRTRGVSRRTRTSLAVGFMALLAVALATYFIGASSSARLPQSTDLLHQALRFVHFFLAVLGSPFSQDLILYAPDTYVGVAAGAIGCAFAVASVLVAWLSGAHREKPALLALGLGFLIFGLGSVLAIAIGRFQTSFASHIESRYATFALYFYVGIVLVFLSTTSQNLALGKPAGFFRVFYLVFCIALAVAVLHGTSTFIGQGMNLLTAHSRVKAILSLSRVYPVHDEILSGIHTVPEAALPTLLDSLEAHRLWTPPTIKTIETTDLRDGSLFGNVDDLKKIDTTLVVTGWARLPNDHPADAVLALVPDHANRWRVVGISDKDQIPRSDVEAMFKSEWLGNAGWTLKLHDLTATEGLTLVAFSAADNHFYRLPFDAKSFAR